MIDQIYSLVQRKKQLQMRQIKYQEKPDVATTSKSPNKNESIAKVEPECDYKHIFKVPNSKTLIENVLDFSPFNFY
jgi:hypothetical protein